MPSKLAPIGSLVHSVKNHEKDTDLSSQFVNKAAFHDLDEQHQA